MTNMISVIVVTFNNFDQLMGTLKSLRPLSLEVFEPVVVNGGNCEKTKKYLEENFLNEFPQGKYRTGKDKGISDAFNLGISLSTGIGIIFLNSGDNLIDIDFFSRCLKIFENDKNIGFIHANVIFQDEIAGNILRKYRPQNLGSGMPYLHQSMVVRKDVFTQIGNFKLEYRMAMDFEFVCRLHKNHIEGHYETHLPVALMDGGGVSIHREWFSIQECKVALIENDLFGPKEMIFFYQRMINYLLRYFFQLIGLEVLVKIWKKYKFREENNNRE